MNELRGPDIVGRIPLRHTANGRRRWIYKHDAEHRGGGIVAIYSYGPAREHEAIVREAKRVMQQRFGVNGAVTSGGISGWPTDEHSASADYNDRTVETQTIFCIHAVGGVNRPKLKEVPPRSADWSVEYVVDVNQAYLGDGEVTRFFAGPIEDEDTWRELIDKSVCEALADDFPEAQTATVLEMRVRALHQGSYWFLSDGDPVVSVDSFDVTP